MSTLGEATVPELIAIQSLIESLDRAGDRAAAELALRRWAAAHVNAVDVLVELGARGSFDGAAPERRAAADGSAVFTVEAPSTRAAWITIISAPPPPDLDRVRAALVVAGRVFGATLARVDPGDTAEPPAARARASSGASVCDTLGSSPQARQLAATVQRLAHSDVGVLIDGETGVGKTFVARLIHEASQRAGAPLRVVNCSAIPESLIESHLFGHERGAFTGANAMRVGVLEAAGAGTILLDEIGELPLASQAKLLHVLEDRLFERVGSNRGIPLRARVLCATNRNLEDMVRTGAFRRDLLFRISVVRLRVPPLRERSDDLLLLATRLLADACQRTSRRVTGFTPEAIDFIRAHAWPGNVRELRNAIEHAIALGDDSLIAPADFPPDIGGATSAADDPDVVRLPSSLAVLERRAIDASLRVTNGNRLRAAALLGVTRQTLYNKLRQHKLHP
jgi:two-component system, NtrC family, response regulator HydG